MSHQKFNYTGAVLLLGMLSLLLLTGCQQTAASTQAADVPMLQREDQPDQPVRRPIEREPMQIGEPVDDTEIQLAENEDSPLDRIGEPITQWRSTLYDYSSP